MSKEAVLAFVNATENDPGLRAHLEDVKGSDAVIEFAAEDLACVRFVPAEGEALSDQELEAVSGGMISNVTASSDLRVRLDTTVVKTSNDESFSKVAASGLSSSADVVLSAGQLAAPYIPGGSVLSAAISG